MAVVTAAVITAGAAVYGASQAGGGGGGGAAAPPAGQGGAIFGQKVKPVKYDSLWNKDPGYGLSSNQVIIGDQRNLARGSKLSADTNAAITASSKDRINGFDPTFMASLSQLYQNRNNELQGNLPYADAMAGIAARGRQANDYGQAGGSTPQTAADLGLSRMDVMNQGAGLSKSITEILNGIDPIARYTTPQDYQITPAQAVPWEIADNQFAAQFKLQNNMLQAAADPAAAGMFNMQQFNAGLASQAGANNAQQFGSYARAASGLAGAFGSMGGGGGYGGSTSGYGGGYSAYSGANQMQPNGNYYDPAGAVPADSFSGGVGVAGVEG